MRSFLLVSLLLTLVSISTFFVSHSCNASHHLSQHHSLYLYSYSITDTDSEGASALHMAAAAGNTRGLEYLLSRYADKFSVGAVDRKGRGAVHYAAETGQVEAVRVLVKRGAGKNECFVSVIFLPVLVLLSHWLL